MAQPIKYLQTKVEAYILNTSVVGDSFFLAPVGQPRYEKLSPSRFNLRHDVQEPVDVRNASPWQRNPRVADVVTQQVDKSRLGIYLHWCLPKVFRAGKSEGGTIKYEEVPDRWLIFRHIDESQPSMPALEIFLVESNKIRKVNDLFKAEQDLETNSSPFLDPKLPPEDQLSTVMGMVSRLTPDWEPDGSPQDFHCPFTVMGSGNPLFADYIPHNAAVFSLHDNLTSAVQGPGSIESAKVSYAVYGFFAKNDPSIDALSICYGTLYSVTYQREHRPSLIEAEGIATKFAGVQPLAVGEDVLDACVAMLQGSGNVQESAVSEVLQQLKAAASLSGSTSQLDRASSSSGSFTSSHGGYRWRVKKKEDKDDLYGRLKPPKAQGDDALTDDQIQALKQLNEAQDYLDSLHRRQRYLRHLVFCEWWKHCIVVDNDELLAQQRRTHAIAKAQRLLKRMEMVKSLVVAAENLVVFLDEKNLPYGPFEKVENKKFFSHADPSFVLRDIGSGWPANWEDDTQSITDRDLDAWLSTNAKALRTWVESIPFDKEASPTTKARLPEVWDLMGQNKGLHTLSPNIQQSVTKAVLAFTSELLSGKPGSKSPFRSLSPTETQWIGQPWRPLFVEWEAEYVHIPVELWQLTHEDDGTIRYGIVPGSDLSKLESSPRSFSGKSLIQPDAQKTLQGMLKMMLQTVPDISEEERNDTARINGFLEQLSLTLGRLDGFTDHLLTLHRGGHVIPTRNSLSRSLDEILSDDEAFDLFSGKDNCPESAGGLDVTPYGSRHEGLSYKGSRQLNAVTEKSRFFRPVTHGQARITKFNIIDRFGQVICAFDPRPGQDNKPFYPHIASSILCEPKHDEDDTEPNTAIPLSPSEVSGGDCPWFQLGPRINQDARLHATFMTAENTTTNLNRPTTPGLSPAADGESGVLAWLLVNFHNRSIQVYDEQCIFRGEAYLPSNPNSDQPVHWESLMTTEDKQNIPPHTIGKARLAVGQTKHAEHLMSLQDLIASMSKGQFLSSLWKSLIDAQEHIQAASTQQSATLPSILVGRPIALANLGLGIELATPPMRSQAYADYTEGDPLQYGTGGDSMSHQAYEFEGDAELTRYEFGIKLGDMLGDKDGLIGYFTSTQHDSGDPTWTLVTDYIRRNDTSCKHRQHPANASPLTVSPNYPSLLPESTVVDPSLNIQAEARDYHTRKAEALLSSAVTVLIDPFLPVNVRSGILPAVSAQLDQAAIDRDLRKFNVTVRWGPTLIGARGSDPVLSETGRVDIQIENSAEKRSSGVKLPVHTPAISSSGAKWEWIQAVEDDFSVAGGDASGVTPNVKFVPLEIMEPLREGFDSTVRVKGDQAAEDCLEMAVAFEGHMLLRQNLKA
ncbi:hypothetical protein FGADI_12312 [Fusarium gaditjirri]|uniref:Uncharacterized protein n=1 Tax=Fusarium gaditjirri TaxID=282569 RepID=A0A8H4SSI6_9HYPO|nr:hypothetical protein FGADI_12312 [Fusarium gaditjirri]